MNLASLGHRLAAGGLLASLAVASCGGKVVFDPGSGSSSSSGAGGTGGAGGAHVASSSTVTFDQSVGIVSATTSTGAAMVTVGPGPPMCSCNLACASLSPCGVPTSKCLGACSQNQISASQMTCLCASSGSDCSTIQGCLGGPGTGPGAQASAGSGGAGNACSDCANNAAMGQCSNVAADCMNSPACAAILSCHLNQCGFAPPCMMKCNDQDPQGALAFSALITCLACEACLPECSNTPLINYCAGLGG